MDRLYYTLVSDGTSDRALLPILSWLLQDFCGSLPIQPALADLRRLRSPPKSLVERIERSIELYPCDLLFVHRDAEGAAFEDRLAEITAALNGSVATSKPAVCIVPVRMSEAWLLIDESAIRHAAGNPRGSVPLALPGPHRLEQLPDPKRVLYETMRRASGLRGRRLASFNRRLHRYRVADWIDDFSPLYRLSAFRRLSTDLKQVGNIKRLGGPAHLVARFARSDGALPSLPMMRRQTRRWCRAICRCTMTPTASRPKRISLVLVGPGS